MSHYCCLFMVMSSMTQVDSVNTGFVSLASFYSFFYFFRELVGYLWLGWLVRWPFFLDFVH